MQPIPQAKGDPIPVPFTHRNATEADTDALVALMDLAIGELQKPFLSETEIASSRLIMGIDTQLIEDGTYFVVEEGERIAGCGGWSRRPWGSRPSL